MRNYFIFVVGFICGAINLSCNNTSGEKATNYWSFKFGDKDNSISFKCDANTSYTFKSKYGISAINIDRQWFSCPADKPGQEFNLKFNNQRKIIIKPIAVGSFFKEGFFEIWKDTEKGDPLFLVEPDKYCDFSMLVSKGTRLDIPLNAEYSKYLYLGQFRKGELIKESRVNEYKNFFKNAFHRTHARYRFWDEYRIRFKTRERAFLIQGIQPWKEVLRVNRNYVNTVGPIYLNPGESVTLPVFLVPGDYISFYGIGRILKKKIRCSVDNKSAPWRSLQGISAGSWAPSVFGYKSRYKGFLKIKAIKRTVVPFINIRRPSFELSLKTDQLKKIRVHAGDELKISSWNKFYVNDSLVGGRGHSGAYRYYAKKDDFLVIKGGMVTYQDNNHTISVKVVSRKGF